MNDLAQALRRAVGAPDDFDRVMSSIDLLANVICFPLLDEEQRDAIKGHFIIKTIDHIITSSEFRSDSEQLERIIRAAPAAFWQKQVSPNLLASQKLDNQFAAFAISDGLKSLSTAAHCLRIMIGHYYSKDSSRFRVGINKAAYVISNSYANPPFIHTNRSNAMKSWADTKPLHHLAYAFLLEDPEFLSNFSNIDEVYQVVLPYLVDASRLQSLVATATATAAVISEMNDDIPERILSPFSPQDLLKLPRVPRDTIHKEPIQKLTMREKAVLTSRYIPGKKRFLQATIPSGSPDSTT